MPIDTEKESPRPTRRPLARLLTVALGILAFGVVVGVVLSQALRPRMGDGDVITGGVVSQGGRVDLSPGAGAGGAQLPEGHPPVDAGATPAELDALARKAEAAPADVEAQLALVRAAIDSERGDLALPALDRILERQPKHPGALTYLGLLTAAQGRYDHGLELIDQALAAAPGDTFALWAKGGLLFSHRRDYAGAAAAWEAMLTSPRLDAGTRATVQEWVAEARWRQEHGEEVERPRATGERAGTPWPREQAAPAAGPIVTGTVSLGPGVTGGPAQAGALFVIVRRGAGAPLAVKRIESPRFPVSYAVGPEDSMMQGRAIEGEVEVVVRLSRSGSAGPARPGDLEGRFARNPVRPGAAGVDIVLGPVAGGAAAGATR